MSRFARLVLCILALTLWLGAQPRTSSGQEISFDSEGGAVITVPPSSSTPDLNAREADTAIPEGTVTIYSSFGSGDSYNAYLGWLESGPDNGITTACIEGMAFTPTKGVYILGQIDLAVGNERGTNGYRLELRADAEGQPGHLMGSWEVTGLPTMGSTSSQVQTIRVTKFILLIPGHRYWLMPVANLNEVAAWNEASVAAPGSMAASFDGGTTWSVIEVGHLGAFDVLGQLIGPPSGLQ